jgi:hypothetical protein
LKGGEKRSTREVIVKIDCMELLVTILTRLDSVGLLANVIKLRIPEHREISEYSNIYVLIWEQHALGS